MMATEQNPAGRKSFIILIFNLLLVLGSFSFAAHSLADSPVPAQPASVQEQLNLARALVIGSGMSRSFSVIIPQFMDQIATNLTQTRPELIRDLNTVLTELQPEFDKQADEMIDIAAHIYVRQLNLQDLKAAVAFFDSPAGKKYVETQPAFLSEVVAAMQGWQSKISTEMMTRVREEMRKKGHEL